MAVIPRPASPVLPPLIDFLAAKPKSALFLRICSKDYPRLDQAFRMGGDARFSDPTESTFETLYCAPDFATCYAETLVRGTAFNYSTKRHEVPLKVHNQRMLQLLVVDVMQLHLIDLHEQATSMGLSNQTGLSDYDYTRWFSYEAYHHKSQPDGIWYSAKFGAGSKPALVLFDRAKPHVTMYPSFKPTYLRRLKPMFDAISSQCPVALV